MRAAFFPFGQGIRNCIGEGFAWTESTLLLSAIVARWQLRLADGADVHPVVSSTLVPSELPIIVTRRRSRRYRSGPDHVPVSPPALLGARNVEARMRTGKEEARDEAKSGLG